MVFILELLSLNNSKTFHIKFRRIGKTILSYTELIKQNTITHYF